MLVRERLLIRDKLGAVTVFNRRDTGRDEDIFAASVIIGRLSGKFDSAAIQRLTLVEQTCAF